MFSQKVSMWNLKKKNTPTPYKIFYRNIVNSLKNASAQLSYNTSPLTKNNISSKYTTPPVKMIDDRWAGLPV